VPCRGLDIDQAHRHVGGGWIRINRSWLIRRSHISVSVHTIRHVPASLGTCLVLLRGRVIAI
jgi:hypothetical protein